MKLRITIIFSLLVTLVSCHQTYEHKTVICIPVYGQSLALGEEAERITDFDSLANYADGRIVTENLDHSFGYFDNDDLKHFAKKMVGYQKRAFELTVYSMAEVLADSTGKDTLFCIFPGGQGSTAIAQLVKGSEPYQKLIERIQTAYDAAQERGWTFVIPALCWMQGESDVEEYPETNYRQLLLQFVKDINEDVRHITEQQQDVQIISYQTNPVSRAKKFNPFAFNCPETEVPQTLMELVRDHPQFHASGPTYPYDFAREAIHIDGKGQQKHGLLVAEAALDILKGRNNLRGLLPISAESKDHEVVIRFNVPTPSLVFDTIQVRKAENYGFSVINEDNKDIAQQVFLQSDGEHQSADCIHILCSESPKGCRVRYAINGEKGKSGRLHGPRGNLRDSAGNWCWQFNIPLNKPTLNDESNL
jgi:hypothetical protein